MSETSGNAPAGWYPDPAGSQQLRWWNGVEWTSHFAPTAPAAPTAPTPQQAAPPPVSAPASPQPSQYGATAPYGQQAQYGQQTQYGQQAQYGQQTQYGQTAAYNQTYASTRPQLAPDARIYNVYIWLVVALPLLGIVVLPFLQPNLSLITASPYRVRINPLDFFGPIYFVTMALGFLSYALTVLFAWLDYRELQKVGVVRPFHWAWAFLANYVYVIGRSVIVRQVAPRRGLVPIWASIGVIVIGIIIGMVWALSFMSNLMHAIPPGTTNLGA